MTSEANARRVPMFATVLAAVAVIGGAAGAYYWRSASNVRSSRDARSRLPVIAALPEFVLDDERGQSSGLVDLHDIADADRALEQQNQAGNKVIENILQAQSNADAEGARNDRDSRHINARSRQCEKKSCETESNSEACRDGIRQSTL